MRGTLFALLLLAGCGVEPTKAVDEPCDVDEECIDGFCYGHVTPLGIFTEAVCHRACIDPSDTSHYCVHDGHCCEGYRCCQGAGCAGGDGSCVAR